MARPSSYSKKLALEIAHRVSQGASLFKLEQEEGMPSARTVLRWCQDRPDFGQLLAHARLSKGDYYFEQSIEIADEVVGTPAEAARQRTRVQARQWAASRLNPARYAEKLALGGAQDLSPIEVQLSANEAARRVAFLLQQAMRERSKKGPHE